ncbi:hypothetical protein A3A39_01130 [Candidatus Kaiserbacteria bacterium RIFCSPLOWO2_01_FULL_54_13]|uniref:Uncharacterized protein n=1 Tax=Candidatus Kaiserbacteria bacterium RIFCSPLOWO2_01_FULL_54_13 TaxID=1798512 RepID=A0A1F6F277_9BACT|nr:MAG: hypothetical protein A3A39_01130 [Candidatus Kaiserbacteria bacterium RIFCSPLOWO2_01_FULL_54_13]
MNVLRNLAGGVYLLLLVTAPVAAQTAKECATPAFEEGWLYARARLQGGMFALIRDADDIAAYLDGVNDSLNEPISGTVEKLILFVSHDFTAKMSVVRDGMVCERRTIPAEANRETLKKMFGGSKT